MAPQARGILDRQGMPKSGLGWGCGWGGGGASKSPGNWLGEGPTWTHLWLEVESQSGSAGTGVGILAISALSRRGTQWHPVCVGGDREKWSAPGSSQPLFYLLLPQAWFLHLQGTLEPQTPPGIGYL